MASYGSKDAKTVDIQITASTVHSQHDCTAYFASYQYMSLCTNCVGTTAGSDIGSAVEQSHILEVQCLQAAYFPLLGGC